MEEIAIDTMLRKERQRSPSSFTSGEKRKISRVSEVDHVCNRDIFIKEMIERKVEYAIRLMRFYDKKP